MPPEVHITSDSDVDNVLQDIKLKQTCRDSTGPKYSCSVAGCDASFKRMDHLDRHEYHHTGIKKHACTYEGCDKIYSILTHLKRHLRITHERSGASKQKTIKCTVFECNKMFTSSCNMHRHVREAHEHPREYACSHCPDKFTQKIKLRRHEITHHTKNYPYKCNKCSRGFYQQWQQESHQRSCKLYVCANCPLQFDKWTLYVKHCRETQHARNRHKCSHCSSSYDKPSELSQHIIAKHTADGATAFACTESNCGRTYAYERNLKQHILTVHTGRRFECMDMDCGRFFSSSQNLAKHLTRYHTLKNDVIEEESPAPVKAAKAKRKKRKDAGQAKRSQLSKLSGLTVDKKTEKELYERESDALDNVAKGLEEQLQEDIAFENLLMDTLEDNK